MILESPGEPTPEVLIVLIKAQAVEIALLKAQAEGDRAIMQKKDLHDFLKNSNGIEKRQSIGARQTMLRPVLHQCDQVRSINRCEKAS